MIPWALRLASSHTARTCSVCSNRSAELVSGSRSTPDNGPPRPCNCSGSRSSIASPTSTFSYSAVTNRSVNSSRTASSSSNAVLASTHESVSSNRRSTHVFSVLNTITIVPNTINNHTTGRFARRSSISATAAPTSTEASLLITRSPSRSWCCWHVPRIDSVFAQITGSCRCTSSPQRTPATRTGRHPQRVSGAYPVCGSRVPGA